MKAIWLGHELKQNHLIIEKEIKGKRIIRRQKTSIDDIREGM